MKKIKILDFDYIELKKRNECLLENTIKHRDTLTSLSPEG